MKREHRYIVFKLTDARQALTPDEMRQLDALADKVAHYRNATLRLPLECVVVESDWPEYEPTWAAIEARVDRGQQDKMHCPEMRKPGGCQRHNLQCGAPKCWETNRG